MKILLHTSIAASLILMWAPAAAGASAFEHFVGVSGDKLMDGGQEFRFISFNIPCLHYNEDNFPFDGTMDWRLPDGFEIRDALGAIQQMGGQVARCYTLSVRKQGEDPAIPRHVNGPGEFDEEAFRALDKVFEVANELGVRIIVPFVDNWIWWGGIEEYASFRGKHRVPYRKGAEATCPFWTDQRLIEDFKKTIDFVINRTNTFTGVKYKDDKAILAWETGNELSSPAEWTREITAYIKSIDTNHLVIDGFHSSTLRDDSLEIPSVDIVTTHHYQPTGQEMVDLIKANSARAKGKKPYFVGEFGFIKTAEVEQVLDTVMGNGVSGALIWSLRYRNRDGGFYWHSEPFGGDLYKSYHWPGFASGAEYDESNLLRLMRAKAFEIRGVAPPAIEPPKAPVLLPSNYVSSISWQGSVGARCYTIERASSADGPWSVVGKNISDADTQYRALFNDMSAEAEQPCFYRVTANNAAGDSPPSNVIGPITPRRLTLVDEMKDFSWMAGHGGALSVESKGARQVKEDIHRLKGEKGSYIVYQVDKPIRSCRVLAFFPEKPSDFRVSVSADGRQFTEIAVNREEFSQGKNAYGYWIPVRYQARNNGGPATWVKIEFTAAAQISKITVAHGGS